MKQRDRETRYVELQEFPGYRVGDDGSVWSDRNRGKRRRDGIWRKLHPALQQTGYRHVSLRCRDGGMKVFSVHRLVLESFVGKCPDGFLACHWNGDRDDNRLENLRWDTPSGNMADAKRHGTTQPGEKNRSAKLSAACVIEMRSLYPRVKQRELALKYGLSQSTVWSILHRKTWAHI